jgi:hypothetical protein
VNEDDRPYLLARSLRQAITEQGRDMKKLALGLTAAAALLAISAATAITAPASAAPIITRDTVTSPIFETGVPHDCRDLTGTIVGTDVVSFQSVETPEGFHIEGTIEDTARIDWSDGSYTLINSVDHFSFNAVGHGTEVFTEAHTDSGDFFSAAGVFEFRDTFHEISHITFTNGVVRADVNKGHFHFFGDC